MSAAARIRWQRAGALLPAAILGLLAQPAAADWLVTRDGDRIETRGAWEVKGRQVIFTLANGTLSSLRAADVDLAASEAATAAAGSGRPADESGQAEPERREPVLVITNDDVKRATPAREPDAGGESDEAEDAAPRPPAAGAGGVLELVSWKTAPSRRSDGLEITGTVRNASSDIAVGVTVGVTIKNEDDEILYEATAFTRTSSLAPGKATSFRAFLPGFYDLPAEPVFRLDAEGISLKVSPQPDAEADGAASGGATDS